MIQKERIVPGRQIENTERLVNKITQGSPYFIRKYKEQRAFDASQATTDDLSNMLATLIADLKKKGIIQ